MTWSKMVVASNRLKDGKQPGSLRHAVFLWRSEREEALNLYGPIENWKTCDITDMYSID
jgi:hypothetical protein